jgi:hypothetical protein
MGYFSLKKSIKYKKENTQSKSYQPVLINIEEQFKNYFMKNFYIYKVRFIASFFIALMLFSSCRLYQLKPQNLEKQSVNTIMVANFYQYVIIHSGSNYWQLNQRKLSNGILSGELSKVNERADFYYKKSLQKRSFSVPREDQGYVRQIHLHADVFELKDSTSIEIKVADIKQAESLSLKKGATTAITVLAIVGIPTAAIAIFLAIACNCPHNYTFDGTNYHFTNTLFTGATAPNLERNDFKMLPDYRPSDSTYQMIVKNELNEQQFTNLLELIAVSHPLNTQVVTDQKGNLYSVAHRENALAATNDAGESMVQLIREPDDEAYSFTQMGSDNFSHVVTQFAVPSNATNAKILVRAKNTKWGGLVYESFAELMGKNYDNWVKHNQKRTPEEAQKDMGEAGIPLIVSIKKNNEWVPVESIQLIGEVDFSEICIPLSEADLPKEGKLEVRITSGFNFWELDAVQMDFSAPQPLSVVHLAPTSAKGALDYTTQLQLDDQNYMAHLQKGDSAVIRFEQIPVVSDAARTLFIRSKGYYLSTKTHSGSTNWSAVMAMRQAGGLSLFSKELYELYSNWTVNE